MKELAEQFDAPPNGASRGQHDPAARDAQNTSREIERLLSSSEPRLGRFLAQMVGNRALAEDLLQDTFYEAFRLRDQLAGI